LFFADEYDKIIFAVAECMGEQPKSLLRKGAIVQKEVNESMNKYESIFVLSALLEDEKIQEIITKVKTLIETSAQLEKVDEWGKKRLAYEIDDQKEGYYTLVHFSAAPEFPAELERIYKITEGVLKYLIVRRDEKE
jgi:small subunit ribosomal protein S6